MQVKIQLKKKKEESRTATAAPSFTTLSEPTSQEQVANRKSYEAWQRWYASQGYPGAYDNYGHYHYYDPNATDSTTFHSPQAPTQGTDTSRNDVYHHYANVRVGDSQNTNTAHYQQYDPNYQQQYYYQQQETEYSTQDDVQNQPLY